MLRAALGLLLVATLAGRVAAMPGWMPMAGANGIEIMLCNGGTMTMPMPGKHDAPAKPMTGDCPFAVAAHAGGTANAVVWIAPPAEPMVLAPVAALRTVIPGRALALPPATGPPALA